MCNIIRWTLNKALQEQTQESSTSVKSLFPRTSWIFFKSQNIRKVISHIRKSGKNLQESLYICRWQIFFFFLFHLLVSVPRLLQKFRGWIVYREAILDVREHPLAWISHPLGFYFHHQQRSWGWFGPRSHMCINEIKQWPGWWIENNGNPCWESIFCMYQ